MVETDQIIEERNTVLDLRLNTLFRDWVIGQVGENRKDGGLTTALDFVESFRARNSQSAESETKQDALIEIINEYKIPQDLSVKIGLLWGARYGVDDDFDINARLKSEELGRHDDFDTDPQLR